MTRKKLIAHLKATRFMATKKCDDLIVRRLTEVIEALEKK